jgi:alpha-tubulin suppressor-like RCC1 family protein
MRSGVRQVLQCAAALALATGCGRIGYDATATVDAGDASVDAPAACALRAVSLGRDHGCAANASGDVYCWGSNALGKVAVTGGGWRPTPVQVPLPAPAVDVAVSSGASCARFADRTIACWGAEKGGIGGAPLGAVTPIAMPGPVDQLVGGLGFFCARLGDGGVACWGDNVKGQLGLAPTAEPLDLQQVSGVTGAVELSAGHRAVCARTAAGPTWCWGDNRAGQLGRGTTSHDERPGEATELGALDQVALGGRHACGRRGGEVRCWGNNDRHQVAPGDGDALTPGPRQVADATAVATLARTSCALGADGRVTCWGLNRAGELGASTLARPATPVAVPGLIARALWAGAHVACAESAGGVLTCWGDDTDGGLGRGTQSIATSPRQVAAELGVTFVEVAVSGETICATTTDGDAWCWGDNDAGAVGNGSLDGAAAPHLTFDGTVAAPLTGLVAAGGLFCGRDPTGLVCWGSGYPGDDTGGVHTTPVRTVSGVRTIALGHDHGCAIVGDALSCWGENYLGQLGTGDQVDAFTPRLVTAVPSPTAVSANTNHTCAIASDGLYCWGNNSNGQIGPSRALFDPNPLRVGLPSGRPAVAVAAGNAHTCAIDSGGELSCWGLGDSGQLGFDSPGTPNPTPVPAVGVATAVWAHADSTCVRSADGLTRCFGANGAGALGNGGRFGGFTPQRFGAVDDVGPVGALGAGHDLRCAVRFDGQLWCAGRGGRGALGTTPLGWSPGPVQIPCQRP